MPQALLILIIVLGVVAVVGHGIWVLVAAIFRAVAGDAGPPPAPVAVVRPATACPHCGQLSPARLCPRCGMSKESTPPSAAAPPLAPAPASTHSVAPMPPVNTAGGRTDDVAADLQATLRQLERWKARGKMDAASLWEMQRLAETELRLTPAERGQVAAAATQEAAAASLAAPQVAMAPASPAAPTPSAPEQEEEALGLELLERDSAGNASADPGSAAKSPAPAPALPPPPPRHPVAALAPAPQPPPATPWTEALASFMEESHIRWGEIVGGLLIVGCSLALVISRWGQIAAMPVLRFSLFTLVTVGLFALGFYSHRRWRLPTTSRGLMVIATLLVPLNFLAMAAYSESTGSADARILIAQAVAGAVFGLMLWRAGKVLVPGRPGLLPIAVMGPSLLQLLNLGWAHEAAQGAAGSAAMPGSGKPLLLLALALAPLPIYLGVVAFPLLQAWQRMAISARRGWPLIRLTALASYAAALPLGLLLFKAARATQAGAVLAAASPVLNLYALPALLVAAFFWRRARRPRLANLRTTATAIGVAGVAIMLAAGAAGWPTPAYLVPIASIDFALLSIAAMALVLPVLQWPALACLILAALLGVTVATGDLTWGETDTGAVLRALFGLHAAYALCALPPLMAGAAAWLAFARNRKPDAKHYARAAACVALLGLLLISAWGLGRKADHGATWIFAGYAAALLGLGYVVPRRAFTLAGLALMFVALLQGMVVVHPVATPEAAAVRWMALTFATLVAGGWAASARDERKRDAFALPMLGAVRVGCGLALLLLLIETFDAAFLTMEIKPGVSSVLAGLWLAALAVSTGLIAPRRILLVFGQAALSLSAVALALIYIEQHGWVGGKKLVEGPRSYYLLADALALSGLIWVVARLALARWGRNSAWVESRRAVMRFSLGTFDGAAVLLGSLGTLAALVQGVLFPAILNENRPKAEALELDASFFREAVGWGAWVLLGLIVLDRVARLWERFEKVRVGLLLACLILACELAALPSHEHNAAGVALRCSVALAVLIVAVLLWNGRRVAALASRAGWPGFAEESKGLGEELRTGSLGVATAIVLALTVLPVAAMLSGEKLLAPAEGSLFARIGPDVALGGPLAILALICLGHAIQLRSSRWAIAGGLGLHLAVTLAAMRNLAADDGRIEGVEFVEILQLNALAAGLFAAGWGVSRVRAGKTDRANGLIGEAGEERFFAVAALLVVGALKLLGLVSDALGHPIASSTVLAASAFAAVVLALVISLRLHPRRDALRALHAAGPAGVGVVLDRFDLPARWLAWWGVGTLSLYALASVLAAIAIVRRARAEVTPEGLSPRKYEIPDWLVNATRGSAAVALLLAASCVFTFDAASLHRSELAALGLRLLPAATLLAAAAALARLGGQTGQTSLRGEALVVGAGAALIAAESLIAPTTLRLGAWGGAEAGASLHVLDRFVVAFLSLGLYGVGCLLAPARLREAAREDWAPALRGVAIGALGFAGAALGLTLLGEAVYRGSGQSMPIATWAVIVVALALPAAVVGAVVAAVRPPAGLSMTVRKGCVYAAEALIVLEVAHLRMTMPWLFGGFIGQFWPVLVMLIAFGGATVSEFFKRRGQEALADPLHRTAVFLPALPLVAAMVIGSERVPAWMLFVAATAVYGLMARTRKSFGFSLLAIAMGSGALWDALHQSPALAFAEHPQLWLIPPAVCVLIAAHLNRLRLPAATLAGIRYACLGAIYLGSTAEVFLRGVPRSPWLPLVLMGLSVAGVLAGVMFRVRSFLFMGTAFLLVAIFSMIWHASASLGWTWIWWVSGIGLGVAIIALFAYFERRRQVMGEVIRGLRQWDA